MSSELILFTHPMSHFTQPKPRSIVMLRGYTFRVNDDGALARSRMLECASQAV